MIKSQVDVSIVLACYNAASFVEENVKQIHSVMEATIYNYELIFVDDKSTDKTVKLVRAFIKDRPNCKLFVHRKNHGRGKTVYDGFRKPRRCLHRPAT